MRLTPLGWIAISGFVIGLVIVVFAEAFIEFTVKGKAWFILGIAAWGVICIFLTVWSFLAYHK